MKRWDSAEIDLSGIAKSCPLSELILIQQSHESNKCIGKNVTTIWKANKKNVNKTMDKKQTDVGKFYVNSYLLFGAVSW